MHRVFVDSNVLGSKTQYDWMFLLKANCRMFAVCTSDDVLDEAHRVWRRKHPSAGGDMRRVREELFREQFDEVLDTWSGGEAPTLNDVDDTHVHNAAATAGVNILLTNNVNDFGDPGDLPYDVYTPDQFFMLVAANNPRAVRTVTRIQALYWHGLYERSPELPRISLSEALVRAGCPNFAEVVAAHLQVLAGPVTTKGAPSDQRTFDEVPVLE